MSVAPAELPGLIDNEVGDTLTYFASHIEPGQAIVEIGSYEGKSTAFLAAAASEGVPVYAVDPWELIDAFETWCKYCDHENFSQPTYARFRAAIESAGLRERVISMQGLSTAMAKLYDGPPIGLLFIDGDHAEAAVLADFAAWRPYLAPGAVVIFDDWAVTKNPGVAAAVERLADELGKPIIYNERLAVARMLP